MAYDDLKFLAVPLPEDLRKLKGFGDYARLIRVIDLRLASDGLTDALRSRLALEKEISRRIPLEYPYSFDEALSLLRAEIDGFTADELEALRDQDAADWIYLNGQIRFKNDFLANVIKTRPAFAPRLIHPERLDAKKLNFQRLDEVIAQMRADGGAARRYRMRHTLKIRPEFVREDVPVTVHLPLPVEYSFVKNFRLLEAGPVAPFVAAPDAAQRTACFRKPLAAGDEFFVEYEFEAHMRFTRPDPNAVTAERPDFFLEEQPPHIAFTPLVRAAARQIAGDETNPLLIARRVYDYLTKAPIYSYVRSYLTYENLPEFMLASMKGDCGIFALTFIALCRCLGVPARWQSGLYCAPHDVGCHDWAEFYAAPYGWLPVDGSFGNAAWHAGSASRHEFYFGNLDPFRLPAAREFQRQFDPPKRFLRSDPYDNQNGEAEYVDEGLTRAQFDEECRMIAWRKIGI